MQFLIEPMRCLYIEKYPIQSLFSFPITPHIQVCQFERGEFIFKENIQKYVNILVSPTVIFFMYSLNYAMQISLKNSHGATRFETKQGWQH
jgi:hypothetical protein